MYSPINPNKNIWIPVNIERIEIRERIPFDRLKRTFSGISINPNIPPAKTVKKPNNVIIWIGIREKLVKISKLSFANFNKLYFDFPSCLGL